jgi:hypothetical protein
VKHAERAYTKGWNRPTKELNQRVSQIQIVFDDELLEHYWVPKNPKDIGSSGSTPVSFGRKEAEYKK